MRLDYGVMRAPANILFGNGQLAALGHVAKGLGTKVLVCTDARFAALDIMQTIRSDLENHGLSIEVFADTEAELPLQGILDCVARYKEFSPDVIVGLGGGSCLDMAKLVSLLLTYDRPVEEFYGEFKVPGPIRPVIAVPTTSGTGSEATPVAVLADPSRATKVGISSPELIPHTAICDPELTVSCPKGLTAISGADALAHAIEAYSAVAREPDPAMALTRVFVGQNCMTEIFALEAITQISKFLRRAVTDGTDLEARGAVMLGSTLAGLAFGTGGTSAAHAIQYPVGAETHTAHGLGIGILLPYVLEYNFSDAVSAYAQIGRAMGVADSQTPDTDAARAMVTEIRHLFLEIGIPDTLVEIDVVEDSLARLAEGSMGAARLVHNNPRTLDATGALTILQNAFGGIHAAPSDLS
jgi:alcohol dehydrogenase class IV